MKFKFSSGITLAFSQYEPALKLNFCCSLSQCSDARQLIFPSMELL
ncbi:hypothetical protein GALLN_00397 [Gallionellaceae bacterium]|nr:hypothetical protein GALLN_00397 [Gallionellaceae bacterium]